MPPILHTVALGIIEGITECLPISSYSHLLIAEKWLGVRSDLFNVTAQLGAIAAIVMNYRQRIWRLLTGWHDSGRRQYLLKLVAAFAVTCLLGMVVATYHFEPTHAMAPIAWALLIGGFCLLAVESLAIKRPRCSDVTWTVAILVGVAQIVAAIFPGTSRLGATIFAALLFGTNDRVAATEFSFLVGLPTVVAATGYKLLKEGHSGQVQTDLLSLAIGFMVAFIAAMVAVKWLLNYIRTHPYTIIALYRMTLGVALLVFM